jgi:hypothetical protein
LIIVGAQPEAGGAGIEGDAVDGLAGGHRADLVGRELGIVDARRLEVDEGLRVVLDELLDLVILEEGDVGQAGAAGLEAGFDLGVDVLGDVDDLDRDVGMGLVIDGRGRLHRIAVEVGVPAPDRHLFSGPKARTTSRGRAAALARTPNLSSSKSSLRSNSPQNRA